MKMLDLSGNSVNADVRASSYPIRPVSKSKLQGIIGQFLVKKFPQEVILEEFNIPGTKLRCDFFIPGLGIVIESQSSLHDNHNTFFHGSKGSGEFGKQIERDIKKIKWAELNGFKFIEIYKEQDLEQIDG